jgi:hypothetical protein
MKPYMKTIRTMMVAILCAISFGSLARADSISLTLDPTNGALTGPAGSTVGWGFTFTNLGSDFAVISGSDFCAGVITSPCTNSFGTYTDLTGSQFILVGPSPESSSFAAVFNNSLGTGLGSFLIDPAATGTVIGQIVLSFDLYDLDPNSPGFDPLVNTISVGNSLTASASVTVGTQSVSVPEPPAIEFLICVAGVVRAVIWRRRSQIL